MPIKVNPYEELLIIETTDEFKFSPIFPNYKFKTNYDFTNSTKKIKILIKL